MSAIDNKNNLKTLRDWQDKRLLSYGSHPVFDKIGPQNVTVLTYFFRPIDQIALFFPYTICAIYETWRHCGPMKTIIVTNAPNTTIEEFRSKNAEWISVQIDPSLIPGDINAMSRDCNSKLYTRFNTDHVLIIQDDGFPLRTGLESFLGKFDYLGAPFRRPNIRGWLASCLLRHCPANGGFSLRTRKICKLAAAYWHKHYSNHHFSPEEGEDMFYTDILPRRHILYRLSTHVGDAITCGRFSYDESFPSCPPRNPFGFHSARAFRTLLNSGYITQ